jgi:alpha-tubulin suppressor-like RCC1 family protein
VGVIGVNIEIVIKPMISAGSIHSLVLDSNSKLWATGFNWDGRLGLGDNVSRNSFQPVTISGLAPAKIVSIAAGYWYSFAIDSNGKLWATGSNDGQLGLGNRVDQSSFKSVTSGSISNATIVSIAAGYYHSLALDSDGKLWAAGLNIWGQLGLGDNVSRNSFQPVTINGLASSAKIVSIAAGWHHSLALDSKGKLWATGGDQWGISSGATGLGNNTNQFLFQLVTFPDLPSNATIVSIVSGNEYSFALDSEGGLWATGYNYFGQLGLGNDINQNSFQPVTISGLAPAKIVSIAVGYAHSHVLDSNGKLWASGYDGGALGLGNIIGRNSFQPVTIPSNLTLSTNIVSISDGDGHSIAMTSDGELLATGWNEDGQLGLGDTKDRNEFMPVSLF